MKLLLLRHSGVSKELIQQIADQHLRVDCITDPSQLDSLLSSNEYDMLLIDSEDNAEFGLEVISGLRRQNNPVPVIMLSNKKDPYYSVSALNAGADDCLYSSYTCDELLARIYALSRRSKGRHSNVIIHDDVMLDVGAKRVHKSGNPVVLSAKEFSLLVVLLENVGKVFSKRKLEAQLYDLSEEVESNTIEVYVSNLRKKLGKQFIKTVRGMGYLVEGNQLQRE